MEGPLLRFPHFTPIGQKTWSAVLCECKKINDALEILYAYWIIFIWLLVYHIALNTNYWNCTSHEQCDLKVTYLRNLNFRSDFVVFRLMKNIIFNKTESFGGRNTSNHACQIFCSKSNCETVYHWFFLLEITVPKIMNNLNVCSTHSYLYPRSRFNEICDKRSK